MNIKGSRTTGWMRVFRCVLLSRRGDRHCFTYAELVMSELWGRDCSGNGPPEKTWRILRVREGAVIAVVWCVFAELKFERVLRDVPQPHPNVVPHPEIVTFLVLIICLPTETLHRRHLQRQGGAIISVWSQKNSSLVHVWVGISCKMN